MSVMLAVSCTYVDKPDISACVQFEDLGKSEGELTCIYRYTVARTSQLCSINGSERIEEEEEEMVYAETIWQLCSWETKLLGD